MLPTKKIFLCFLLFEILQLHLLKLKSQPISGNQTWLPKINEEIFNQPVAANYSGVYRNGFMLKKGEWVYSNTDLMYNGLTYAISNNIDISAHSLFLPEAGVHSFFPITILTPRFGMDLNALNHISGTIGFAFVETEFSKKFVYRSINYSFGTPRANIGLVFTWDDPVRRLIQTGFLQYSVMPFKWLKIGAEHWISGEKDKYQRRPKNAFVPYNFSLRFLIDKRVALGIGYMSYEDYFTSINQIPYANLMIRLNSKYKLVRF